MSQSSYPPPHPEQPAQPFPPQQQGYYQPMPPGYYPPVQPMPAPKKKRTGLWVLLAILLVIVVAACAVAGIASQSTSSATTATTDSSTSSSSSSGTAGQQTYRVGQTVSVDSTWQVTITHVRTNPGDGTMNVPKSGNVYLLLDVTEKNISGDQQAASGLAQFSLRGTDGTTYDEDILYSKDPGGTVSAGQPLKGVLAYEVPKGVKHFLLNFQSGLVSQQTTWDITA